VKTRGSAKSFAKAALAAKAVQPAKAALAAKAVQPAKAALAAKAVQEAWEAWRELEAWEALEVRAVLPVKEALPVLAALLVPAAKAVAEEPDPHEAASLCALGLWFRYPGWCAVCVRARRSCVVALGRRAR